MHKERRAYLNWLRDHLNLEVEQSPFSDALANTIKDAALREEYADYVMQAKYEGEPFYRYGPKRNEWLAISEAAAAGSNIVPFHLMPLWKRALYFILFLFFIWLIGEIFF